MTSDISWTERFYTHFLGRDLCHIFGGGLFICIVEYAYFGEIFLPNGFTLEVIGFLMFSYFIGIVINNVSFLKFTSNIGIPANYSHSLLFLQDLIENYDVRVLNQYERYIYFYNVGKSFGMSSFLGGIVMTIIALSRWMFNKGNPDIEYNLLASFLLVFGIFMSFHTKKWAKTITEARTELAEDMISKH